MEPVVASILGLSGSDADLAQLNAFLKLQGPLLANHQDAIAQAMHTLDPFQHSLGMLWLLESFVRLGGQAANDMTFVDMTATFLTSCQPHQIRMVPDLFSKLARKFREMVMAVQCPRKGILPLIAAVRALQPTSEYLTPIHSDCFMLCLASKCYNAASQLISEDIFYVDPNKTACVPRDFYLYCRYGSMLCIGRKQWARAVELQMCAMAAPSLTGNAIVLDCYKQYVLVSLILSGSVPALPKVVPQPVRIMIESDARPYSDLASAYTSHKIDKLVRTVDQHAQVFAADVNTGLVAQVVESLISRNIQRLTSTYLTLSLADIASQVGLPSAESAEEHILRMVSAGDIFASISDADGGMVRFSEDCEQYTSTSAAAKVSAAVRECMALAERVAGVHDAVAASKEYLRKVISRDKDFTVGTMV